MRALCIIAVACVALVAGQGCKRVKREPVPGPQSVMPAVSSPTWGITALRSHPRHSQLDTQQRSGSGETVMGRGAGGIAWFQGSVEEAFSRAEGRRNGGPDQHASPPWTEHCPGNTPAPERVRKPVSAGDV